MSSNPIYNFSAGPCLLPKEVYDTCAKEMHDWHGTGLSVMEMSHRSPEFVSISEKAKADLRKFLSIPENFKIFFFQGGASLQYASIVKNLLKDGEKGAYLATGLWSEQCINQAKKMCPEDQQPQLLASDKENGFHGVPEFKDWNMDLDKVSYVHYCQNETVHGVQFKDSEDAQFPFDSFKDIPVVCDMSSDIASRPIDFSKYGVIYAGAQKNLGAAGCTVVIVREDLIGNQAKDTPFLLDWDLFNKSPDSYFNTPATYPIYVTGLNLDFMLRNGGLEHY
mmetsp:Transcript_13075/g.20307  ORF Transcript_13075/g.20307 Transcript_13075/m.20307 type:complete len:279 (+) Transcript_13075:23-859(+)